LLAQIVRLDQVAEAVHRRLVRHRLAAQVNADKTRIARESYSASSTAGSDRVEPLLQQIDA